MNIIEQTYTIKSPVNKVWDALTKPELMEQWGAGPAEFDDKVGGKFSLWGGDIHGTNTKVVPIKLLVQDWYEDSVSDLCYKVSFSLIDNNGVTTVKLTHSNVPESEVKDFTNGWRDYYFDPIKQLLEDKK